MSSIGEIAKFRTSIQTDTINEFTSASGVTVDGVLLKDSAITASGTLSTFNKILINGDTTSVFEINRGGLFMRNDISGTEYRFGRSASGISSMPFYLSGSSSVGISITMTTLGNALSTTVPCRLYSGSAAYTDNVTAASGTVSHGTVVSFDNPAIAATNASVTYTSASTLYIDGAPTAGSNVTIGSAYSLYIADGSKLMNHAATISTTASATSMTNTFTLSDNMTTSAQGLSQTTSLNQATYNASRAFTTAGGGLRNAYLICRVSGASGTVTGASNVIGQVDNTGAGTLTDGAAFYAEGAINSGGGTFTRYYSYYAEASTAAATNYAFYANNAASGTERYNFYAAGTAPNVFTGAITTPRTTLTASATGSGAITVINNYHAVSGAGGAASTITTINGGIDGMMVVLKAVSDTVDIVFATGGNILLDGGASFTCDTLNDTITLIYDGSLTKWLEIGRCNNA